MTTKEKLALLNSFYEQAVAAGLGAKFHCDGILLLSCFQDDGGEEIQPDLEIPGADRPEGRHGGNGTGEGPDLGASSQGERRES
jgi:hypothetical protein